MRTWQRLLNLAICAALVVSSTPVHAVQVQIRHDIRLRQLEGGHEVLGILKAGSIIDVAVSPEQRQNTASGAFDLHKTLQSMIDHPVAGAIAYKTIYGERMPLFKVTVVRKAAHSSYNAKIGGDTMIALQFLERRGKTFVNNGPANGTTTQIQTSEDTPVYSGSTVGGSTTPSTETAPAYCANCDTQPGPVTQSRADELANLADSIRNQAGAPTVNMTPVSADDPSGKQGFQPDVRSRRHSTQCNRFIDTDGDYGDLGREVISEIEQNHPDFDTSSSFADICPNYNKRGFNKRRFQVWVVAAISLAEAGCRDNAVNRRSPHGHARGLFQMEDSVKYRARRPYYRQYCQGSMGQSGPNLRCGLEIMDYHLVSKGRSLYDPSGNNYWDVLKKPNTDTKKVISRYAACTN